MPVRKDEAQQEGSRILSCYTYLLRKELEIGNHMVGLAVPA